MSVLTKDFRRTKTMHFYQTYDQTVRPEVYLFVLEQKITANFLQTELTDSFENCFSQLLNSLWLL